MKRTIGIIGHAAIAATILAWSIWAGYTFWRGLFGSEWAAVGALLALDAAALWGFVMHVLGIPSPFARVRHALPLLSALPLAHSLHTLAAHAGDVASWAAALTLTALLALFSWLAWRGLERLLIDPASVQDAEVLEQERRASAAVRRISSEAAMTVRIIAAMRDAVMQHERLLLDDASTLLPRQQAFPPPVEALQASTNACEPARFASPPPVEALQASTNACEPARFACPQPEDALQASTNACEPARFACPQPEDALQASTNACEPARFACPRCGAPLSMGAYGAARKHGRCRQCK